jgi:hypothetical protein
MSGTLRGTLYYTSEQVSSHLHRRFSVEMAENTRCRLSASVYVNAIDESEMINPVDQSGGFGGCGGCVLARAANIFSPSEEGVFFLRGAGGKLAKPGNPAPRFFGGSGRDVLAGVSACLTLLGVLWSPSLS